MSVDGGSTFNQIYSFANGESVVDYDHSGERMAFLTDAGRVYHSRPRSYQVLELEVGALMLHNVSRLVFDSTGQLNAIGVHAENGTVVATAIPLLSGEKVNSIAIIIIILKCMHVISLIFSPKL